MAAFDPLQTLKPSLDEAMISRFRAPVLAILATLLSASCGRNEQPAAKPLADGCYYADRTPVLKVQGSKGLVLVPGPVHQVSVKRFEGSEKGEGEAWVVFSPAFIFNARPLSTSLTPETPEIYMQMKRGTARPTIDTVASPNDTLELVQGSEC